MIEKIVQYQFVFILLFLSNLISGQDLPLYREYQKTIEKKTRNHVGTPGVNYWQNKALYTINAEINLKDSYLYGNAEIYYINNSPDSLKHIYFRLYQNMYARGSTRNIRIKPGDIHEGVNISYFSINGTESELTDHQKFYVANSLMRVNLEEGLSPGDTIRFSVKWDFHIPEHTYLRMGRTDSTTFFIAYWYPQIAVYDDIYGWDTNSYLGLQEFYNDFSDFYVTIRVPCRNGIWGTGILVNPDELFKSALLEKYRRSSESDETITLISEENVKNKTLLYKTDRGMHNWKFSAENVTDFAFATGDHFIWEASSLELSEISRVHLHSIYRPEANDFKNMITWMKKNLEYFAREMPGTVYPFPSLTVSETVRDKGDGGMEFPMICNNPSSDNYGRAIDIMSHEIAHMYFPFMVGMDETRNGWMDEGFACYLPKDFMAEMDPNHKRFQNYANIAGILGNFSTDMPIFTPTFMLESFTIFNPTYAKPALALVYLEEIVGKEKFASVISAFIDKWKYKHANPYDFFYFFNNNTEEDLNWFFRKWYFERHYPDIGIGNFSDYNGNKTVQIINYGGLPLPVQLTIHYKEKGEKTLRKSAGIWESGENKITIHLEDEPEKIVLGKNDIPDSNQNNNIWERVK